jgi:hypothetical protein
MISRTISGGSRKRAAREISAEEKEDAISNQDLG